MPTRKHSFVRKYFTAIAIAFSCTFSASAQTGIDTALSNALQASIESLRASYNVKGISAAAYIPGKGIWKGVTGVSYGAVPIDTTMLFDIGSITKTFVATEILKLVEAGQLSLSDTIGALLPPLVNINTGVTVRQLLSHTSGLGEYLTADWGAAMFADPTAIWYYPVALETFCPIPAGPAGSPWHYCNTNYALLGMIIEAKKSDSLHRVLRNELVNPLHLNNTYMEVFETYPNPIPHNWSTPTLNPTLAEDASATPHEAMCSSTEGPGGFYADPVDLVKWGYNLYSGNVLSAASLAQMLDFIPAGGGYFNGYGLGSMRFVANSRTYYGHGGNFYGYAASMLYYPVDSICVAVLINQDCIATYEARSLMNVLIKKLATLATKENTLSSKVTVMPNPANTQLKIEIPATGSGVHITVLDILGKVMYQADTNTGNININTTDYSNGEYIIKICCNSEVVTKQLTIQH